MVVRARMGIAGSEITAEKRERERERERDGVVGL